MTGERLEHYVAIEIDVATVGVEPQLVVTTKGGWKNDRGYTGRHIDGIDDVVITVNYTKSVVVMAFFKSNCCLILINVW